DPLGRRIAAPGSMQVPPPVQGCGRRRLRECDRPGSRLLQRLAALPGAVALMPDHAPSGAGRVNTRTGAAADAGSKEIRPEPGRPPVSALACRSERRLEPERVLQLCPDKFRMGGQLRL